MTTAPLTRLEDHDLVLRVATGDIRAFEAIYERHSAQVFGLAMQVTGRRRAAEEATQDAFLGVWRAARSYDQSRGTFKTWLLSMVRNRSIDWLRREARHGRDVEIDDALSGRLEAAERTEEQVADREESVHSRKLLLSLPDDQRRVIELAYFKGLTQSEISQKVGIPLGTVKGRQRLALKKMHRNLTTGPEFAPDHDRRSRKMAQPLTSHDAMPTRPPEVQRGPWTRVSQDPHPQARALDVGA